MLSKSNSDTDNLLDAIYTYLILCSVVVTETGFGKFKT